MQPGSEIYVTIDRYLLAIIMFKWKKLKQSSYQFEKRPQNVTLPGRVFTPRARENMAVDTR